MNLPESMRSVSTAEFDTALKQREESKREQMLDPQTRWRLLQQAIAWGERQKTVRRNTREECLRRQAILLQQMSEQAGE